jgi:hypothetical protein
MLQIAENTKHSANVIRIIPSTTYHWFKFSPNDMRCLLSKTAKADYIELKTKQTLKRIKSQDIKKSMQFVVTSKHSQS